MRASCLPFRQLFSRCSIGASRLIFVQRSTSRIIIPLLSPRQFSSTPSQFKPGSKKHENDAKQNDDWHNEKNHRSKIFSRKRLIIASVFSLLGLLGLLGVYEQRRAFTQIFYLHNFSRFTIIKRENISPTIMLITVRPQYGPPNKKTSDPYKDSWEQGTWSLELKQPDLQIARLYTPLPPTESDADCDLRFLIRKERKGEVSGYLHSLPLGSTIWLRGPHPEIDLRPDVAEVVFLAGGTGIAPALQVVHTLLERRDTTGDTIVEKPRIRIVWANRRREDCEGGGSSGALIGLRTHSGKRIGRIVQELEELQQKYPQYFSVEYLVDEEETFLNQKKITQLTRTESELKYGPVTTRVDSKLIFVSGPEGFITFLAGPKGDWEGGRQGQGEIGGILGRMRLRDWKIWKL